jgi:hypothetical protein
MLALQKVFAVVFGFAFLLASSFARAEIVVTALVAEIAATLTPIGLVAMAVLSVIVGTKVFKYIRRAL